MASLKILAPDATTNYVRNPSMRYDTTGYTAVGSTLSRALTRLRFGIASLKIITNGSALYEGAYYRINWLSGVSSPITASVYLRGSGTVRLRLIDNPAGKEWHTDPVPLTDDRWQRLSITGYSTGSNDLRLYVETDQKTQSVTFYADGFQLETKAYPTTYCDGDQEDCSWSGVYHASISSRSADTRAGGRWVVMAGKEREEENLYMTTVGGLGVAPIRNNIQPYADSPGSYFQNIKVLDRPITMLFHAKHRDFRLREPTLRYLHQLRRQFFDIIKPGAVRGSQAVRMEYQDGNFPIYFSARYEAGLEGDWDIRNGWKQSFPIRFLANSPFLEEDTAEAAALDIRDWDTVNYALRRIDGTWYETNGGLNGTVYGFATGPKGEIIAWGNFTRANNDPSAVDPEIYVNFIAYWDGYQWQKLGSGANGVINGVSVGFDGRLYVTGAFTSIGGVAANYVAYYTWSTSLWSAMGSGFNAAGLAIAASPDGRVYAGGNFTLADGNLAAYAAFWDGSSWHNLGYYGGFNAAVYSVSVMGNGDTVVFGGAFTDEYTSPGILSANYVAYLQRDNNQLFDLGLGFDNLVRKVIAFPDGRIFACGDFTASSTDAMLYIAWWNGSAWYDFGGGANDIIRDISVFSDGRVLAAGDFTRIGGQDIDYAALWNGNTWVDLDVQLNATCYACHWDPLGNIYLSPNSTLAQFAGITSITNPGTAETNPRMYFVGPLSLRWIENQTTQKRVYLELTLLSGEEVFLDFAQGTLTSATRGDLTYAILPGSDLRAFVLSPKENKIALLAINDMAGQAHIAFNPRHWSVDSTAQAEAL